MKKVNTKLKLIRRQKWIYIFLGLFFFYLTYFLRHYFGNNSNLADIIILPIGIGGVFFLFLAFKKFKEQAGFHCENCNKKFYIDNSNGPVSFSTPVRFKCIHCGAGIDQGKEEDSGPNDEKQL